MKLIPYKDGYLVEFGQVLLHPLIAQELSKLNFDDEALSPYSSLLTLLNWHLATPHSRLAAWWSAECEADLHDMFSKLTLMAKGEAVSGSIKFPPPTAKFVFATPVTKLESCSDKKVIEVLQQMFLPYQLADSTFVKVSYEDS